jgi:hypothetical protein
METRADSKSPRSAGQMHGYPAEFDPYRLRGGRDRIEPVTPLPISIAGGLAPSPHSSQAARPVASSQAARPVAAAPPVAARLVRA